jgi:hypothetical protein
MHISSSSLFKRLELNEEENQFEYDHLTTWLTAGLIGGWPFGGVLALARTGRVFKAVNPHQAPRGGTGVPRS